MSSNEKRIAIPSLHPGGLDADRTPYFGRCECFTIVLVKENKIENVTVLENAAGKATSGAGSSAAMLVAKNNVSDVIGGDYGPNAAMALRQANIKMFGYLKNSDLKVNTTIQDFLQGKLPIIP